MSGTDALQLSRDIERLFQQPSDAAECRESFARLREELSAGRVRAAEPDPAAPSGWRVNAWVKQGILLGLRSGALTEVSSGDGPWFFADKDTLLLKRMDVGMVVRVVPGGSSARDVAYLVRGVICMPSMHINIAPYVGDESLIDSHALVGAFPQVGRRVHVTRAQIGGSRAAGALPVIAETRCWGGTPGRRCLRPGRHRGGHDLTGSTPSTLPNGRASGPLRACRSS